jgi:thioredoxin-like negative regulator of GroEL
LKQGAIFMMKSLFIIGSIFFGVFASAAPSVLKAPDFQVAMLKKAAGLEVVAVPPTQHHFNIAAPLSFKDKRTGKNLHAERVNEREIRFVVPDAKAGEFQLSLYLCDNAKTFCERHSVLTQWNGDSSGTYTTAAVAELIPVAKPGEINSAKDQAGFFVNKPDEALRLASRKKMPLLIEFYGIWCPPCNELNEEVFTSKEFKAATSSFVKLKLDADLSVSWRLKSKYKVGGYPTVVFTSFDGEEISRIVGFRKKDEFIKQTQQAWISRNYPLSKLRLKALEKDREALDRLGLIHLQRKEYGKAIRNLEGSKVNREQYFEALIGSVEEKQDGIAEKAAKLISLLKISFKEFPNTPDSVQRRLKLANIYKELNQPTLERQQLVETIDLAKNLMSHPEKLKAHEVSTADLWATIAESQESLGDLRFARESWKKSAIEFRRKIKSGSERSHHLGLAYSLWKSGDTQSAEMIYEIFEKKYPEEFTFYFNHAQMKMSENKFQEAENLARQAFKYAYGDNQLRAAHLLGKSLYLQGRRFDALKQVNDTLKTAKIPRDKGIRTHRYIKDLQDLADELNLESA